MLKLFKQHEKIIVTFPNFSSKLTYIEVGINRRAKIIKTQLPLNVGSIIDTP